MLSTKWHARVLIYKSKFYYTNKQTLSGRQNWSSSDSFINLFDLLLVSVTQSYLCQSKLKQTSLCSEMQFEHFLLGHGDSIISLLKSHYLSLHYFVQIKSHKVKFQKKQEFVRRDEIISQWFLTLWILSYTTVNIITILQCDSIFSRKKINWISELDFLK